MHRRVSPDKIHPVMTYAIIKLAGHQYQVLPGGQVTVTGDFGAAGSVLQAPILLDQNNDAVSIGTPLLDKTCALTVLSTQKGEKIRVAKYHAKSRNRRVVGHRQFETTFKVSDWSKKAAK